MKLASKYLSMHELFAQGEEEIKSAFETRLDELGFGGITIEEVSSEFGGDTIITFAESEGEDQGEMDVLFTWDADEGAVAVVLDENDLLNDDDEIDIVVLDPLEPKTLDLGSGAIAIDLLDLSWLNNDGMDAILMAGGVFEAMQTVIRNGKKVKIPLVRKTRKKRLTPAQKQGIRKATQKRKAKSGATSRKRKKSLKKRKSLGVKNTNKNKRLKGAGTKGNL